MSFNFGWREYWEPTPTNIRKIADAVVAGTTFGGSVVVMNGNPKLGTGIFIAGVVAKIISNFFSGRRKKKTNDKLQKHK